MCILIHICVCLSVCVAHTDIHTVSDLSLQCSLAIRLVVKLFGSGASCFETLCLCWVQAVLVLSARALQGGSTAPCEVSLLLVLLLSSSVACRSWTSVHDAPAC